MKKTIVILTALLFTIGLNAQEVKFGLKGGLNLSQLSKSTVEMGGYEETGEASDMLMGFHVGGLLNVGFGEFFGLQPELMFSMQGGKETESGVDVKFKLNYINVPVLFEVKPLTGFSLLVGPQIGLNISRAMSMSSGGMSATVSGSDFDDALKGEGLKINKIDFAAVVGVQYAVMGHFLIGARYNLGFSPVMDSDISNVKITGGANRVIQVSVGWLF